MKRISFEKDINGEYVELLLRVRDFIKYYVNETLIFCLNIMGLGILKIIYKTIDKKKNIKLNSYQTIVWIKLWQSKKHQGKKF